MSDTPRPRLGTPPSRPPAALRHSLAALRARERAGGERSIAVALAANLAVGAAKLAADARCPGASRDRASERRQEISEGLAPLDGRRERRGCNRPLQALQPGACTELLEELPGLGQEGLRVRAVTFPDEPLGMLQKGDGEP